MSKEKPTRFDKLMQAGENLSNSWAISTDQTQALGMVVIAEQLAVLNENIELLAAELKSVRERLP